MTDTVTDQMRSSSDDARLLEAINVARRPHEWEEAQPAEA